ncbi:MAG: hypothetical protein HFG58_13695 [Lachnospiraceae bacterium]|nr:hypothetical protein [Lachnospiraceae bacterium]MCI8838319.1 hypothetical protein [Hungatella sp.]
MLKTVCICDRCGKEFETKLAKRIVFESALPSGEASGSKLIEMIAKVFKNPPQDFCPECVTEIRKFMDSKRNGADKEELADEPG